jgi:P-type E1-E2 ATPase
LVKGALERGLKLAFPVGVVENPGQGIEGSVEGHRVSVGSSGWLVDRGYDMSGASDRTLEADAAPGRSRMFVGVDGRVAGAIVMGDSLRDDASELVEDLHKVGIGNVAMVTGDRRDVAEAVGSEVGVDLVYAEQSPQDKLKVVRSARLTPGWSPVIMVGDGVNDAPALALADVGVALGTAGATVSSETADAVITVDRIGRVAEAVRLSKRALYIARQSVVFGIGLSVVAMLFAAAGFLPPLYGALLQEAIDVAVILNALRALRG